MGPFSASSKDGDLDLIFRGHLGAEMSGWLCRDLSQHLSHGGPSYSVYRCIMGPFSASSKDGDLDLIFQGHLGAEMSLAGFATT